MSRIGNIIARQRAQTEAANATRTDRNGVYYKAGAEARRAGQPRDSNPYRYTERDPNHPDLWEAQWDLGWDEAAQTFGELLDEMRARFGQHPVTLLRGPGGFVEITREDALEATEFLARTPMLGVTLNPLERLGALLLMGDLKR